MQRLNGRRKAELSTILRDLRFLWKDGSWLGKVFVVALFVTLAALSLCVILILLVFLVYVVDRYPSHNLDSKPELDVLYDIANILLPIITVLALLIAWNQLKSSERSSRLEAHFELFESIIKNLDNINRVNDVLYLHYQWYSMTTSDNPPKSSGVFLSALISDFADDHPTKIEIVRFLVELENIGLLVRRGYVSMDDIFLLLEGPFEITTKLYGDYIQNSKDSSADKRLWEHAHWLLVVAKTYKVRDYLSPTKGTLP